MSRTEIWLELWKTLYAHAPSGSTWESLAIEAGDAYESVYPRLRVLATDVSLEIEERGESIYYEGSDADAES